MPKFFVEKENINNDKAEIFGQDAKHISKVLRMSSGESLTVCDGEGYDYDAEITEILQDRVMLKIKDKHKCPSESFLSVTLFQCLPKAAKMDFIIEKCTELGVSSVVPVASKRCVVKIDDKKTEEKKIQKWQKCADEAAKQCRRGVIPLVEKVVSIKEAAERTKEFDLAILAYELEDKATLKSVLTENSEAKKIGIFIGPEGGFDEEEVLMLTEKGAKTITLGKRILRTETAGLCVLSSVMYALDGF